VFQPDCRLVAVTLPQRGINDEKKNSTLWHGHKNKNSFARSIRKIKGVGTMYSVPAESQWIYVCVGECVFSY